MKELTDILGAIALAKGEPLTLVTVVAVEGSTYRRPGARMLVLPTGRIGSISGGCLEDEVCRKGWWLAEDGPVIVTYDTGMDEEPGAAGYALGCRGRVSVLIERIDSAAIPGHLKFIQECQAARKFAAVAIAIEPTSQVRVGDWLALAAEGESPSCVVAAGESIIAEVMSAMSDGRSRHTTCNGGAVFIEVIPPPVHLIVCGAGHDAEPVVELGKRLGWQVSVVSRRPDVAARFRDADGVFASVPEAIGASPSRRSAAIVMSHNYPMDLESLEKLLLAGVPYVGVLGPRARTDTLLADLEASGLRPSEESLARIHAPVGLDIGAESPVQVALAIIAEIQAFFGPRPGGSLRDRNGPIHEPVGGRVAGSAVPGACGLDDHP